MPFKASLKPFLISYITRMLVLSGFSLHATNSSLLDTYERPFTLLDLTGSFSAAFASKYPSSTFVTVAKELSTPLCKPNIVVLNIEEEEIKTLLEVEHIDLIVSKEGDLQTNTSLLLSKIHWFSKPCYQKEYISDTKRNLVRIITEDCSYTLGNQPGISLVTFLACNGLWPNPVTLEKLLSNLPWPYYQNLAPWDLFLQGETLSPLPYSLFSRIPKPNQETILSLLYSFNSEALRTWTSETIVPLKETSSSLPPAPHIHFLYTSALIENRYELRKLEYLKNLQAIHSFGYKPHIIEATNINHSFFDDTNAYIYYPKQHNSLFKNLTSNEIRSLLACLDKLPFQNDDLIIKITGRYLLFDDYLLHTILNHPGYDLYAENWLYPMNFYGRSFLSTGCFAMKWSLFKQMLSALNLEAIEHTLMPFERILGRFVQKKPLKFYPLTTIHMAARSGSSTDIYLH